MVRAQHGPPLTPRSNHVVHQIRQRKLSQIAAGCSATNSTTSGFTSQWVHRAVNNRRRRRYYAAESKSSRTLLIKASREKGLSRNAYSWPGAPNFGSSASAYPEI